MSRRLSSVNCMVGNCLREHQGNVRILMQDYKCLRVAVMICATLDPG